MGVVSGIRAAAPGRPAAKGGRDVLTALLLAAKHCLSETRHSAVTSKEIAERAGVTQAMVNYYFGGREGLLAALFEEDYRALTVKLDGFEAALGDRETFSIADLIGLLERHFEERESMLVLLYDEIYGGRSQASQIYTERLASRAYAAITRIVEKMISLGLCRTDVAPAHVAYAICCLATVPAMLEPVFALAFDAGSNRIGAKALRREMVGRLLEPVTHPMR